MSEQLNLTSPHRVEVGTMIYKPVQIILTRGADPPNDSFIEVLFHGSGGQHHRVKWDGEEAWTLLKKLNSANLSTTSLTKRVIEQAVTDGKLPDGTVGGTPDV